MDENGSWHQLSGDYQKPAAEKKFSDCKVLENFKTSLKFVLDSNQHSDKVIILSDSQLYSTDFSRCVLNLG